jgi:hypothetical protein
MKMQFANKEFDLLDGEYYRYVEEDGTRSGEYLCMGICGENKVLFQYIDTTDEAIDYIKRVVENIPDFALGYLSDVLDKYNNILVRLMFVPALPTSFEIYYNCDCTSNDMDAIIGWMADNNDFAATQYRYTEIVNGHQKCVGE